MYVNLAETIAAIASTHDANMVNKEPKSLYDPRNYIMSMTGKKLRSLLCCLSYGLYKDDIKSVLEVAHVVELFHNFSLVHDDIMDDADMRRGQESVHIKYDESSAILSGDVMLIEVYDRLSGLTDALNYIKPFNKMARLVCEGQAMDMDFETRDDVTIAEYLKMIEYKTAVLIGLSLQLGAKCAGASIEDQERLYGFGVNAGVGFQLQDDYLDVYGDPEKFGKKVGGDIIQGKKTYLYLRAQELLSGQEKVNFEKIYMSDSSDEAGKVDQVTQIFDDLYIKNYCEEAKNAYFDLALSHMSMVNADADKKEQLVEFSRSLVERER